MPVTLVTYTNSVMNDAWDIYFGQLDKHVNLKSIVFSDIECTKYKNHKFVKYDNNDPYYKQYLDCLKNVEDDFIIYMQEDFFAYDDIDVEKIKSCMSFLKNTDYSFVRLIRAGYKTPLDNHIQDDLYEVDANTSDAFTMQVTLWKKDRLVELYDKVKSEKWYEGENWNSKCQELEIKGVFTYNGENKRGKYHYDSIIFPYTCTGINKGHWNLHQYGKFLIDAFKEYDTDTSKRGFRLSDNEYIPTGQISF